jgi:hypothetical protein
MDNADGSNADIFAVTVMKHVLRMLENVGKSQVII